MATSASRNGNTLYISSATSTSTISALTVKNIKVISATVTAVTAGNIILSDVTTNTNKIKLTVAANETKKFDFEAGPIVFPNGIRVTPSDVDLVCTLITRDMAG